MRPLRRRFALLFAISIVLGTIGISALSSSNDDVEQEESSSQKCFATGSLRIPRERNLSLKDYYEKYEDTQTPVIIEDYADAFAAMSESNIMDICGKYDVSIARRVADEGKWANIEWYKNGPLIDTWREIDMKSEERTASSSNNTDNEESMEGKMLGVFDWALQNNCPELLEKHFIVPKYFAQDYLQRVPHSIDLKYRDSWPSLFIGVDGTYGGTHRDTFGSAFWMFVIDGAKEWVVVDSAEELNFFAPNKPRVRHYHDIVGKGQLLIIPGQRWHQVRNRGNTVTLAGNFISRGSFGSMKKEVGSSPDQQLYYTQLQKTLLVPGFNTSIDYEIDDMTWEEFRAPGDSGQWSNSHETLAVFVSGAGSSEVNGCYLFNGRNGNAWQFELRNRERTFEIFKVGESDWWNILERVGGAYPNPVHYGTEGSRGADLPPRDDWGSIEYRDYWIGMSPMPKVEIANEKNCLRSREEANRAPLAEE